MFSNNSSFCRSHILKSLKIPLVLSCFYCLCQGSIRKGDNTFLHCDNIFVHRDNRFWHCCLGLTATMQSQSRNIFLCIIRNEIVYATLRIYCHVFRSKNSFRNRQIHEITWKTYNCKHGFFAKARSFSKSFPVTSYKLTTERKSPCNKCYKSAIYPLRICSIK